MPDTVTSMGSSAFYGCTGLKSIKLSENLTTIPTYAFYNCNSLTGELVIPEKVEYLKAGAFSYMNGITSIVFGSNFKGISGYGDSDVKVY